MSLTCIWPLDGLEAADPFDAEAAGMCEVDPLLEEPWEEVDVCGDTPLGAAYFEAVKVRAEGAGLEGGEDLGGGAVVVVVVSEDALWRCFGGGGCCMLKTGA